MASFDWNHDPLCRYSIEGSGDVFTKESVVFYDLDRTGVFDNDGVTFSTRSTDVPDVVIDAVAMNGDGALSIAGLIPFDITSQSG